MEPSKEEAPVFLDRTSRATRGKRITKLRDEDIKEDELFWSQDAFKEEENDANYEEETEAADESDSDSDENDAERGEEGEDDTDESVHTKKRSVSPEKLLIETNKKKKVVSKLDTAAEDGTSTEQSALPEHNDVSDGAEAQSCNEGDKNLSHC